MRNSHLTLDFRPLLTHQPWINSIDKKSWHTLIVRFWNWGAYLDEFLSFVALVKKFGTACLRYAMLLESLSFGL